MTRKLTVNAVWDEDATMWVATSEDIPGLVTEAPSLDTLLARVMSVAPELIEDNAVLMREHPLAGEVLDICIVSQLKVQTGRAA